MFGRGPTVSTPPAISSIFLGSTFYLALVAQTEAGEAALVNARQDSRPARPRTRLASSTAQRDPIEFLVSSTETVVPCCSRENCVGGGRLAAFWEVVGPGPASQGAGTRLPPFTPARLTLFTAHRQRYQAGVMIC